MSPWLTNFMNKQVTLGLAPKGGGQGLPTWQEALDAAVLEAQAITRSGRICLVLSDHFVRYALLPWSDAVKSRVEEQAYAIAKLASIYGNKTTAWMVTTTTRSYNEPQLAAAISAELRDACRERFATQGQVLVSMKPRWIDLYNRVCKRLDRSAVLVSIEPGLAVCGFFIDGILRGIHAARLDGEPASVLPSVLRRQGLIFGLNALPKIWIEATMHDVKALRDALPDVEIILPAENKEVCV